MIKRICKGSVDKNGDEAYFFRADKSDCNGYALCRIDTEHFMLL